MPVRVVTIPAITLALPVQFNVLLDIVRCNILLGEFSTDLPRTFGTVFAFVAEGSTVFASSFPISGGLFTFPSAIVPIVNVLLLRLVELVVMLECWLTGLIDIPWHLGNVLWHMRVQQVLAIVWLFCSKQQLAVGVRLALLI